MKIDFKLFILSLAVGINGTVLGFKYFMEGE